MLKKRRTRENIYVDTSFFIATQIINHPYYGQACQLLKEFEKSTFHFSLLTVDEIVFTLLKHKLPKGQIVAILEQKIIGIKNTKLVSYKTSMKQIHQYMESWMQSELAPRDAMHVYLMKSCKLSCIATFDADFRKQSKKLAITVIPQRPVRSERTRQQ
jgi:predicted nucleic acid-binding protein